MVLFKFTKLVLFKWEARNLETFKDHDHDEENLHTSIRQYVSLDHVVPQFVLCHDFRTTIPSLSDPLQYSMRVYAGGIWDAEYWASA